MRVTYGTSDRVIHGHLKPEIAAFCVAKLGNRPAITCVPRLERDNYSHSAEPCLIQSDVPYEYRRNASGIKPASIRDSGGASGTSTAAPKDKPVVASIQSM